MGIAFMMVVYTVHVTCQDIDGGATEADGGASAPVGPSVATPLHTYVIHYAIMVMHEQKWFDLSTYNIFFECCLRDKLCCEAS